MKKHNCRNTYISIVSGFLGSGKTTFLQEYMQYLLKTDEKITIIMNEFGTFDVDSLTFNNEVAINALVNGCVCCDLKADLVAQLKNIIADGQTTHIIIEATGIAHPLEIMMACQDPEVIHLISEVKMIGILDASRFLHRHRYSLTTVELMEEQLAYSSTIIINKMDLINDQEQKKLSAELTQINPQATTCYTTFGQLDITTFNNIKHVDNMKSPAKHAHHHGIKSMQYTFSGPIDRQLVYQFILKLPQNVFRLKGFVRFRDCADVIYEFQYAHGLPSYGEVDKEVPLTIVIIGEHIDVERLRNNLDMLQFT